MERGRIGTLSAIVFAGSSLSHCVGATEIMVDLHTDVECSVVGTKGVTIAVGDGTVDPSGISTKATSCDGGEIGTIAFTPSGDIGGPLALRVVLGVNARADDCASPKYSGCIVARRSLRYSPHTKLTLPIELDQDCLDNPCSADSTCIHGACTDGGVICENNVCDIDAGPPTDAGPPDAGSCTDTLATPLTTTTVAATPRIARTTKGYAIAFQPDNVLYAETVDANGTVISPEVAIATLTPSGKVHAIATDTNDQHYLVVYEDNGALFGVIVPTSGGTASSQPYAGMVGPISGAFWEPTQSMWVTAGSKTTQSFFLTITTTPNIASPITSVPATGLALARFGTTYYATDVEGSACVLRTCALQPSATFACQPNVFQGCSAIRAAADAQNVVVSYVMSGTMYFENAKGGFSVSDGPIDDPEAMVPLVVGATPYRIVWRSSNVIVTDTFPTKLVAATTLDASGFTGAGAGFDAVADDPSQTGYAVVYFKVGSTTSTIQFQHRCK